MERQDGASREHRLRELSLLRCAPCLVPLNRGKISGQILGLKHPDALILGCSDPPSILGKALVSS